MNLSQNALSGLVFGVAASLAVADDRRAPKEGEIDDLKTTYLSCDRAANAGRLATSEIMQCSVVYEELKRRVFDNDVEKLNAWVRAQAPAPGKGAPRAPG